MATIFCVIIGPNVALQLLSGVMLQETKYRTPEHPFPDTLGGEVLFGGKGGPANPPRGEGVRQNPPASPGMKGGPSHTV